MRSKLLAVHPVLAARDVTRSIAFFENLGFKVIFQDAPHDAKYVALARDGVEIHLQWADSGQWDGTADRPVYRFLVSDVDALYQEFRAGGLAKSGATPEKPWAVPANTPWGTREFHVHDPAQNGLQFYRPTCWDG